MKIDPRHLVQIAEIVDRGTFMAAAERLGTSQPALSRVVAMVEERIGTALFDRANRPPTPTEAGLALAEQGRAIRAAADNASLAVDRITKGDFGSVRIGAPPFLCDHILSDLIIEFLSEHPRITVELIADFFPVLQTRLLADQIDMIVGPTTLVDRTLPLESERLLDDTNVIVCRAGHPLSCKPDIEASDLDELSWIKHSEASTLHADMQVALAAAGVKKINARFASTSPGAVLKLLLGTDCLTMLPHNVAKQLTLDGRVNIIPFTDRSPSRPIGIVTHSGRAPAIAIPTFAEFLRSRMSQGAGQVINRQAEAGRSV